MKMDIIGSIAPHFREESQTWVAVREWLLAALIDARKRNDNTNLSADETAAIRGEIRLIKRALTMPEIMNKAAKPRPQKTHHDTLGLEY